MRAPCTSASEAGHWKEQQPRTSCLEGRKQNCIRPCRGTPQAHGAVVVLDDVAQSARLGRENLPGVLGWNTPRHLSQTHSALGRKAYRMSLFRDRRGRVTACGLRARPSWGEAREAGSACVQRNVKCQRGHARPLASGCGAASGLPGPLSLVAGLSELENLCVRFLPGDLWLSHLLPSGAVRNRSWASDLESKGTEGGSF